MKKPTRRRHGTVTIQHVAQEAGVSAMTVSRVINGETNVRATTRQAVLDAVAKLNYSPNTAARSLAAGEALHLGLLYANPPRPISASFWSAPWRGRGAPAATSCWRCANPSVPMSRRRRRDASPRRASMA